MEIVLKGYLADHGVQILRQVGEDVIIDAGAMAPIAEGINSSTATVKISLRRRTMPCAIFFMRTLQNRKLIGNVRKTDCWSSSGQTLLYPPRAECQAGKVTESQFFITCKKLYNKPGLHKRQRTAKLRYADRTQHIPASEFREKRNLPRA